MATTKMQGHWDDDEEPIDVSGVSEQQLVEDKCQFVGCDAQAVGRCKACKSAGYCSLDHMLEHYDTHVKECASCVQTHPSAVHWAVEVEVGQTQGEKDEAWEPEDLVHARVNAQGRVTSYIQNRDLVKAIGLEADFESRDVFPGSKANDVPRGRFRLDHPKVSLYLMVTDRRGTTARVEFPLSLPHDGKGSLSATGTTVHVDRDTINKKNAKEYLPLPSLIGSGSLVVGLDINDQRWQIWGNYDLIDRHHGTLHSARKGVTRLSRRAIGHHKDVVRVRGIDSNGTWASITFRHKPQISKNETVLYQIHEISMHVDDLDQGQTGWAWRTPVGFLEDVVRAPAEVFGAATRGLLKDVDEDTPPPPPESDFAGDDEGEAPPPPPPEDIYTRVQLEPTDPLNRLHVTALVNWLASHQDAVKAQFIGDQLVAEPADVRRAQTQLAEVARIRNVLERHLEVLAAEEAGEKDPEVVGAEVGAALGRAEQLIGLSASERWKRFKNTRAIKKDLTGMKTARLKEEFLKTMAELNSATGPERKEVGSHLIREARAYSEEMARRRVYSNDPEVTQQRAILTGLRGTQGVRRKAKRQDERTNRIEVKRERDAQRYGDE